jgi:uncharacterized protein (DUF1778 family)
MVAQTKQPASAQTKTEKLDLRLSPKAKATLAAAAEIERRTLSDFVVTSALAHAEETLADQRHFVLTAEQWEAFHAALDAPDRELSRIRQLFGEPSVFEKRGTE